MKIKNLFLGLLVCVALASCSNESIVEPKSTISKDGTAYMNVNIVAPQGSRAAGDQYQDGTAEENAAGKALFLFYYDGQPCGVAPVDYDCSALGADATKDDNIYGEKTIALELNGTIPNQVVTILNYTSLYADLDAATTALGNMSMDAVRKVAIESYADTKGQNFIMTNSVYSPDNNIANVKYAATILPEQIYSSQEQAEKANVANSVNIPVERVVAKVNLANAADVLKTPFEVKTAEGGNLVMDVIDFDDANNQVILKNVTVKAQYSGFSVAYNDDKSNMIKDVDAVANWADWNDAANFRSYWGSAYAGTFNIYSAADGYSREAKPYYCFENTNSEKEAATFVFTAKLQLTAANGQLFHNVAKDGTVTTDATLKGNFYRVGSTYYTERAIKQLIINKSKLYKDAAHTTPIAMTDITLPAQKDNKATLDVNEACIAKVVLGAGTYYDGTGKAMTQEAAQASLTADFSKVYAWKDCETYYFTNIKNCKVGNNTVSDSNSVNGIIRNSIYNINVNSITGLGTSITDNTDPITPTKPDTPEVSYLSATIYVLAWRVNNQTVDL